MNENTEALSNSEINRQVEKLLAKLEQSPDDKTTKERLDDLYRERSLRLVDYSF